MSSPSVPDTHARVVEYQEEHDLDIFLFADDIRDESANALIDLVIAKPRPRTHVALFVTTYGGDADAAYRIGRCMLQHYEGFRLLVEATGKSAGTLLPVAASELAFSPTGELGPLDVQMTRPDEIVPDSSGLDVFRAVTMLEQSALATFRRLFAELTLRLRISTPTAAEIASTLTKGLYEPIASQIDPHRLGQADQAISIARDYGTRLGANNNLRRENGVEELIAGYPSHSFVIDQAEAGQLFKNVRGLDETESMMAREHGGLLRSPPPQYAVFELGAGRVPDQPEGSDDQQVETTEDAPDDRPDTSDLGDSPGQQRRESGPTGTMAGPVSDAAESLAGDGRGTKPESTDGLGCAGL